MTSSMRPAMDEPHPFSEDPAQLVTPKQAAAMLGQRTQTLWRWARDGRIPAVQVDGRYLYSRVWLDSFVASRRSA